MNFACCSYEEKIPSAALAKPNPESSGLLLSLPKLMIPWNGIEPDAP
jgi:hypothetical protein